MSKKVHVLVVDDSPLCRQLIVDAISKDPDIDVVGVITHINDHRDITVDALRSGKHVFLEKPMAPTVADCDQIVAAAGEATGFFMVGHICRFDPLVALAKQAIEEAAWAKSSRCTPATTCPSKSAGWCWTASPP